MTGKPLAAAMLALALTACGSSRRSEPVAGSMDSADPQVVLGEQAFMRHCDSCHPGGEPGLAPGINAKPLPAFVTRFQIRNGLGAMPAFSEREIGDEQVEAIIAYLEYMRGRRIRSDD